MLRKNVKKFTAFGLAFLLSVSVAGGLVSAAPVPISDMNWTGIITFEKDINPIAKAAIVRGAGGAIETDLDALNMAIVSLPSQAVANGLTRVKGVLGVEADSIKTYCAEELPWGVDRIDADQVWKTTLPSNRGDGVNVAVLDTGIDTDHPDLAANIEGKYSCVNRVTSNVEDSHGHGTHCSGIIAGIDNEIGVVGVGPEIDLYMVQISRTGYIKESDIVEGINWCVNTWTDGITGNDIQVMSMSFGGGYSLSEAIALQAAYDRGIVLVAAAGNESGAVIYPAALDTVIAVSAVGENDIFAWFSNLGEEIELAAPGVSILSTYLNGSYATMSGTSMACPHVAGVAALVIASGTIEATSSTASFADEVRARMRNSAEDIGLLDEQQGFGLVDAQAAVGSSTIPESGSISGTVTDNSNNQPIVGAIVSVDGMSLTETTDDNGNYQISGIPVGTYTVTATATGYQSNSDTDVLVVNGSTTNVDFALTPVTLPGGESMTVDSISFTTKKAGKNLFLNTTVKVVDEGTIPVSGATVTVSLTQAVTSTTWNFTGTTLADGTVTFSLKTTSGTYTATIANNGVTHPDYTFDYVSSTLEASVTLP